MRPTIKKRMTAAQKIHCKDAGRRGREMLEVESGQRSPSKKKCKVVLPIKLRKRAGFTLLSKLIMSK